MQPIVHGELAVQDLGIVHLVVRDFSIGQSHGHRVVPRLLGGRGVDGDPGGFFEFDHLHINSRVGHFLQESGIGILGQNFVGHPPQSAFGFEGLNLRHGKTPAAVVEQPLGIHAAADGPVGDPVGFEVIPLVLVHGNQQTGRLGRPQGGPGHQSPQKENPHTLVLK